MRRLISGCLLALALVASSHAQTPLFLDVQPSLPGGSPPPTVNAYYDVEIDFDALRHAPEELEIALPDGEMFIAEQTARNGILRVRRRSIRIRACPTISSVTAGSVAILNTMLP